MNRSQKMCNAGKEFYSYNWWRVERTTLLKSRLENLSARDKHWFIVGWNCGVNFGANRG